MTKEFYEKISKPFRRHPMGVKGVVLADKLLTLIIFAGYPMFLLFLLFTKNPQLYRSILVPGISFVIVSAFRRVYSAGRPYELLDIDPLIKKDTVGKSFPSRHVFSIYIIAATFYNVFPSLGIAAGIAGVFLALVRVIGGVHFPKDVVAGAVIGILFGIAGYGML